MNKRQHKHHIDVETDQELVTVTIGADGGIPGGFAKLFNRVVDSEVWAQLSDAGRAVYIPLVRFADQRNQFRVGVGRAKLMHYTGLSLSSVKRGLKDLVAHKLIVIIEQGGVSASGENEANVYQLLAPAEGKRPTLSAPAVSSEMTPLPVHGRTPSPAIAEPPAGPELNRPAGQGRPPWPVQTDMGRGFTAGPQYRSLDKELNKTAARLNVPALIEESSFPESSIPNLCRLTSSSQGLAIDPVQNPAAALLESKGVDAAVARQLAAEFTHDRIVDVVATMEYRKARGTCTNPGGFIRQALVGKWQTPQAVIDARTKARAKAAAEARAADANLRSKAQADFDRLNQSAEEARIDRLIDSLDDDELAELAKSILAKYQENPAVLGVLTRKPPRACRLMRMEIAAMLDQPAGKGSRS